MAKRMLAAVLLFFVTLPGMTVMRTSNVQAQGKGNVAGWVSFGTSSLTSAAVLINCKAGCNDAQMSVLNAASFDCAAYTVLAGPAALTGNCFVFKNISKDQQITVHVGYPDGHQVTIQGYFFGWQPFLWLGVAKYPNLSKKITATPRPVPTPPSDLRAVPAGANETDPYAIRLYWTDNSDGRAGFRIVACENAPALCPQLAGYRERIQTIVAGSPQWAFGHLRPATRYCFRVAAVIGDRTSAFSNQACATTRSQPVKPSPTPAAPIRGTVLYQADWSRGLDGWATPPQQRILRDPPHDDHDWHVAGGMLVSDGTTLSDIASPYQPGTAGIANYAVETDIRLVSGQYLGISIRRQGGDGYAAIVANMGQGFRAYLWRQDTGELSSAPFDPGSGWHTYRVEARNDRLSFVIDNQLMVTTTDSRWNLGGWVGLYDWNSQLAVRSFRVLAL